MSDRQERDYLKALLGRLKEEREHLAVQAELGKMEARDEWRKVEDKWNVLESMARNLEHETREAFEEMAEEVSEIYDHLRRRRKD
ncbi:MAG: hypothetical protein AAGG11_21345 [Pseudomonadota bacterium]